MFALHTRIMNLNWLGRKQEAKQDLAFAEELIARNPHLQPQAYNFRGSD
jgi:hypothetical protein